jgi:hypothetical protein
MGRESVNDAPKASVTVVSGQTKPPTMRADNVCRSTVVGNARDIVCSRPAMWTNVSVATSALSIKSWTGTMELQSGALRVNETLGPGTVSRYAPHAAIAPRRLVRQSRRTRPIMVWPVKVRRVPRPRLYERSRSWRSGITRFVPLGANRPRLWAREIHIPTHCEFLAIR